MVALFEPRPFVARTCRVLQCGGAGWDPPAAWISRESTKRKCETSTLTDSVRLPTLPVEPVQPKSQVSNVTFKADVGKWLIDSGADDGITETQPYLD